MGRFSNTPSPLPEAAPVTFVKMPAASPRRSAKLKVKIRVWRLPSVAISGSTTGSFSVAAAAAPE
jgi:hypothetical protein